MLNVWKYGRGNGRGSLEDVPFWPLTDGEVHTFYWFIQGSIMNIETRHSLWHSWGFCERHAWAAIAVEIAFRPTLMLCPCILYEDLLQRCIARFSKHGPLKTIRVAYRLLPRGPCMTCEMDAYHNGPGAAPSSLIERGRATDHLRAFALAYREHWEDTVCGTCRGDGSWVRCRRHLIEEIAAGIPSRLTDHRIMLERIHRRLVIFGRSFVWGHHGIDQPEDRASLISAVGWFGGWRPLLELLDWQDDAVSPPPAERKFLTVV